jgi:spermidine synthase
VNGEPGVKQPPSVCLAPAPVTGIDRGRPALVVDGVVQSVTVECAGPGEYWPAMLPDVRPHRALLLGAGGGTLAALLRRRFGRVRVVAVDDDPRVVELGRRAFYLGEPGVEPVIADAFAFAAACPARFDYIAVDLFRGGERPAAVLGRPFLNALRRLAEPRGRIAVNLFHDKRIETSITRVSRVLTVTDRVAVGRNVILHCRAR